jgi:hypothetical protein
MGQEIFDSLPYYDNDLVQFPDLKQKVDQELAREPKPPAELHPDVPPSVTLFEVSRVPVWSPHVFCVDQLHPK